MTAKGVGRGPLPCLVIEALSDPIESDGVMMVNVDANEAIDDVTVSDHQPPAAPADNASIS
nr:hypothetical protein [Paraburkholderia oxyphila]